MELDGAYSYKYALAYLATSLRAFAHNTLDIVDAWATRNREWGIMDGGNGALEAAWGAAAMAKVRGVLVACDTKVK